MRALVVSAPMRFGVRAVPDAAAPEGGLLLKVEACGLCGSDLRTLRSGHRKVTLPWTIGHEVFGTVAETGVHYEGGWKPGARLTVGPLVYCGRCDYCRTGRFEFCEGYREIGQAWPGGLAEWLAIPVEMVRLGSILPAPPDLEPAPGALVEPVSSCVNAQERGRVGLGDTVVVIGAGPIGCIHIALAQARGADRVVVIDIAAERLAMAEAFEPDRTIDASRVDPVEEIRGLTSGRGAEVVVTATPAPVAIAQAVDMARKAGRILVFGGLPGDDSKPSVDFNTIHYNALELIGTTIFAPRHQMMAMELIRSRRVPADRLITHVMPLERFEDGARLALAGKALKVVFMPGRTN